MSEARIHLESAPSTLLYTAMPCGCCLVLVMVNDAENLPYCARDIVREAREGRPPHEATKAALPPMRCPEHAREEAERASMLELGL